MKIYNFVKKHNISKTLFVTYFIFFAVIIYFASCALFGSKGFVTYMLLQKEIANHNLTKQDLQNKLQAKKNMVDGMNVESLDLDLLDEEARRSLGYSNKNEVVIYPNQQQKTKQ